MFKIPKVFLISLSVLLVSTIVNADVYCSGDKTELQMINSNGSYKIRVKDLLGSQLMSVESLREQLPGMDDSFYEEMAKAAQSKNIGYQDLGACSEMDTCRFHSWDSEVLVSCEGELAQSTTRLEVVQKGEKIVLRCTQNGSFEISNSLINGTGTGTNTITIDVGLLNTDCGNQNGEFVGISATN